MSYENAALGKRLQQIMARKNKFQIQSDKDYNTHKFITQNRKRSKEEQTKLQLKKLQEENEKMVDLLLSRAIHKHSPTTLSLNQHVGMSYNNPVDNTH